LENKELMKVMFFERKKNSLPHPQQLGKTQRVWRICKRSVSGVFRRSKQTLLQHLDVGWLVAPLIDWMMLQRPTVASTAQNVIITSFDRLVQGSVD
jgi:hypothetical protein